MAKFILGAALALVLAGCGGGSEQPDKNVSSAPPAPKLVVIGNSLTVHPVSAALGWNHVSGMAASDAAHDFAHLVASSLGAQLTARNFASLERNPADPINSIDMTTPMATQIATNVAGIDAQTDVVVQLGDNAQPAGSADFTANYGRLLDALPPHHSLTCVSTWWQDGTKDAMMQAACTAHGGAWVFIGDIFPARTDVIPVGQDSGVAAHPHDPSMAIIAARILPAIF